MTRKTKTIIKIVLLVVFLAVSGMAIYMVNTKPSKNDHMKVLAEQVNKFDMTQLDLTEEERAQYDAFIGGGAKNNIMEKVVKPRFEVVDYGLWSVGYIKGKDFKKKVTSGMFNKVTLEEELVPQTILDAYRNAQTVTPAAAAGTQQEAPTQ